MKISVITVCFNAASVIESTIKSVVNQNYKDLEYLVIDGGSTDQTLELLKTFEPKITQIVSESDEGIYDAMNKGAKLATGEILYFLNAGDTLSNPEVLQTIADAFTRSNSDVVYGDVNQFYFSEDSQTVLKFDNVTRWLLIDTTICHQAMFITRKFFQQVGNYTLKYKIAADYEWLLRAVIKQKAKMLYLNFVVCNYSMDGVSSNPQSRIRTLKEYDEIARQYFSSPEIYFKKIFRLATGYLASIYHLFKTPKVK